MSGNMSDRIHEAGMAQIRAPKRDLEAEILAYVRQNPFATGDDIREAIVGRNVEIDKVRRRLLAEGKIVREARVGYLVPRNERRK